jgi:hypothetical protein
MSRWLEENAQRRGSTAAASLRRAFDVEDVAGYWATVANNMEAQRFRLIFVSDVVGVELRKIIEFLNGQMARTDVLATEVKQYRSGDIQRIVPRIIGDTQEAKDVKRPRGPLSRLNRELLLALLRRRRREAAPRQQPGYSIGRPVTLSSRPPTATSRPTSDSRARSFSGSGLKARWR